MRPDFTGEWGLNREASNLTGGASAMDRGDLRIDHRDPKCAFQIRMIAGDQTVERAWESTLTDEPQVEPTGFYSHLFWEGDTLVFECGSKAANEAWSMVWRYELLESGRDLRAVEQMRGHSGNFDNTWVFEKR